MNDLNTSAPDPQTAAEQPFHGEDPIRAAVVEAVRASKAAASEPPAAPERDPDAPARNRDEGGKFTKAEGADAPAAEADDTVPDADPAQDKDDAAPAAIDPPKSWSADEKAEWSKLSPAAQRAVLRRETEIDDAGRRWSEEKRSYVETLTPLREAAQRAGIDPREGLNRLLAANAMLEADPGTGIRRLAQMYGIDLSSNPTTQQARPQADPTVVALQQKLSSIEAAMAERDRSTAMSEIEAFKASPGREHFDTLKQSMGQLIASGAAKDLADAYDKAAWADPTIREKLISAREAKAVADKRAKEKEIADKAKRGAISANGSRAPGAVSAPGKTLSVDEAVREAWRLHSAG